MSRQSWEESSPDALRSGSGLSPRGRTRGRVLYARLPTRHDDPTPPGAAPTPSPGGPMADAPVPPDLETAVLDTLLAGVLGKGAHVDSDRILDGLPWELAGPEVKGSPYTILQNANHIIFWNGYTTAHLDGLRRPPPAHAPDGWPGPVAPGSAGAWDAFVRAYKASLAALARPARQGPPPHLVVARP